MKNNNLTRDCALDFKVERVSLEQEKQNEIEREALFHQMRKVVQLSTNPHEKFKERVDDGSLEKIVDFQFVVQRQSTKQAEQESDSEDLVPSQENPPLNRS